MSRSGWDGGGDRNDQQLNREGQSKGDRAVETEDAGVDADARGLMQQVFILRLEVGPNVFVSSWQL